MAELTEPLIGELAAAISVDVMEKIALGRFNISYAALRNIKSNERGNAQAVSREILRTWSYKNPDNQLKSLAQLLYKAAEDGDVDPPEVSKILKVGRSEAEGATGAYGGGGGSAGRAGQRKKLTEQMRRNLALCVVSEEDLRDLGTFGFGVRERIIDAALTNNNRNINAAATEVIKRWAQEQEDMENAYELLCGILRKIRRNAWINELED